MACVRISLSWLHACDSSKRSHYTPTQGRVVLMDRLPHSTCTDTVRPALVKSDTYTHNSLCSVVTSLKWLLW